jgi:hypothetical protein
MMFTLLGMSYVVLEGLGTIGASVGAQDAEDFIHMWRLIGYLIGIEEENNPCLSFALAKATTESLFMHQIDPSETSARLARKSIEAVATYSVGGPAWSESFHCAVSRALMGEELADRLRLPRSPLLALSVRFMFTSMHLARRVLPAALLRSLSRRVFLELLEKALGRRPGDPMHFAYRPGRGEEGPDAKLERARTVRMVYTAGRRALMAAALLLFLLYRWYGWRPARLAVALRALAARARSLVAS